MRYILEFLRGDPERPLWSGLSEAQWTTMALTIITLLLSMAGWLPLYNWHVLFLIIMTVLSAIVVAFYRKNIQYIFFSPPHIRQLATGLKALSDANATGTANDTRAINIYTTRMGLHLSCGSYIMD